MNYLLPAVIGLLLVIWGSLLFLGRLLKRIAWKYCPEAVACVESVSVFPREDRKHRYVGGVSYVFSICGQIHSGWCSKNFSTEQEAWEFVAVTCHSRNLRVRFKPEDPDDSLLLILKTDTRAHQRKSRFVPV